MSKPRLIFLSDMFGATEESWMKEYTTKLSLFFEVIQFDCRELAGISSHPQEEIHSRFVNGGIEKAVQRLKEIDFEIDVIVGFSVGGTIAWKYALENSNSSLCLISATRLRNEIVKPSSSVSLYFGELENNGPKQDWFEQMKLGPVVFKNEGHECYKSKGVIEQVCREILTELDQLNK